MPFFIVKSAEEQRAVFGHKVFQRDEEIFFFTLGRRGIINVEIGIDEIKFLSAVLHIVARIIMHDGGGDGHVSVLFCERDDLRIKFNGGETRVQVVALAEQQRNATEAVSENEAVANIFFADGNFFKSLFEGRIIISVRINGVCGAEAVFSFVE